MAAFEELVKQQKITGDNIENIIRNFKKDPTSRKQTVEYYQERLRRLDEEWSKFETADNQIRLLEKPPLNHDYFTKEYYTTIMEIVNQFKEIFEASILQLIQTRTPRSTTSHGNENQQKNAAQEQLYKKTAEEQQLDASNFIKLVRRQGAMIASLQRSLGDNFATHCLPVIQKLWENIENIHFKIFELYDNPTEQGYNEEQFIILEDIVRNTLQESNSGSSSPPTTQSESIPLPKITIPKFDGNYLKWQEFHDLFTQLVIKNPLSKVQKIWYLKTHLVGEASNLVKHFSSTGENFDAAWTMLLERYNNKRLLVTKLIDGLVNTPASTSVTNIKRLHDTTQECLLALQNLEIDTSTWDPLLLHLLLKKLDQATRMRYEQSLSKPREIQTIKAFLQFLENHFQSMEAMGIKEKPAQSTTKVCTSVTSNDANNDSCSMCKKGKHPLFSCKEFLQKSISERFQFVQKQKYCHNCLKPGHISKNCILRSCTKCKKMHNTLLHFDSSKKDETKTSPLTASSLQTTSSKGSVSQDVSSPTAESAPSNEKAASLTTTKPSISNTYVLLSTAMVKIKGNGKEVHCRAILDSGSQVNFITERLVKRLGISTKSSSIFINGIGLSNTKVQHRVNVALHSRVSDFTTRLEAAVLPRIISPQPSQEININQWPIPNNITLADPTFNRPDKIDILLGAEFHHQLLAVGQIKLADDMPILQNTLLGWIIAGKVGGTHLSNATCGICTSDDDDLETAIARLWEMEDVTTAGKQLSVAEKQCEEHFTQNTTVDKNGRFVVKLPFQDDPNSLGESHGVAYNRFLSLERRLAKSPQIKDQYIQFMKEYEALGHMTQIDIDSIIKPSYFIPHHCIVRPESLTTKLRVVFDASAKSSSGLSLNDLMYNGPTVQSELFAILLRFRLPRFVFTTDVEKMYRQMLVHPEDRKFQIVIWREDSSKPIKYYQLNTITYGTRSAPYLATRCLQQIGKENTLQYPLGSQFLQNNFYVDDGIGGSDSLNTTLEIQQQLKHMLNQHGLNLQKWSGNHPQLLKNIGTEEKEVNIDFDNANNQTIKTLGLAWMPKTDQFCVKVCLGNYKRTTKRTVSSDLARLFDPLGILAPIVVMAKIFIQDLWQLKLTWDEALPAELHARWITFRKDLDNLNNMQFSRHIFSGQITSKAQIHCFSDASEKAYGAAVYIRSILKDGRVIVRLLCAKSRVAPLKRQTVPRLELCASVLGAQLTTRVKTDLQLDVPTYFWTDSQIVLAWINSPSSSYQTFVANRIAAIQEISSAGQWWHVSSQHNPADVLSRGISPRRLAACTLWFYGPLFLHGQEGSWPQPYSKALSACEDSFNMERKATSTPVTTTDKDNGSIIYNIEHNGSFKTLQRVTGYMLRFINHARKHSQQSDIALTVDELENALMVIVRTMQRSDFAEDLKHLKNHNDVSKNSSIGNLTPFLDTNGLIRVGGRLRASELPYDAKHQMLIPYNDPLTKLLMQMIHKQNRHCGGQALLSYTRQRFWPIKGKSMTRSIIKNCVRCTKAKPELLSQIMGNLPSTRVTPARPFINSGVDFCGPFWVHFKVRGKKPQKAYIAVFCCFATKAVHLELVSDLTTDAFLGALRRFISRRGHCQNLYCDNATNFVGAKNQLAELHEAVHSHKSRHSIVKECSGKGITFHFIPPRAPHFGGLWEAAVKSAKHLLIRSTSTASLTYEELDTVTIEVEGILNSRPISPMSEDPNDLTALTPGHFLIGEPFNAQVDALSKTEKMSLLARWKLVSHIKHEFWKRWSRDYLCELQSRNKWKNKQPNISIGDMVIIKEDNTPVLKWPLGRVTKTFAGDDRVVRVADVKTATGSCRRPIHRLAPLPLDTTEQTQPTSSSSQHTKEENIPTKKRRISIHQGITTLLVTLLILPLVLGVQIQNRRFGSKLGIHFEEIGTTAISTTEWKLIIYYELKGFSSELAAFSNGTNALRHLCQKLTKKSTCQTLIAHFQHMENELQLDNSLLKGNRYKRGAVDVVGNVAHSLFGILDSEYAKQMSETITQVKENEEHLLSLLKNQTSIVDSTINILKQDQKAIKTKFDSIDRQINEIFNRIRNDSDDIYQDRMFRIFTSLSIQLTLIANNLQRMQASILDVLIDTHHGQISPLLLTPNQLQNEVHKIKSHLSTSLELPVKQEDVLQLYKLMQVKGGLTKNHVVFSLTLPLVEHERYELFNLIPIPNWVNGTMISIDTCSSMLAINSALDQYFPLRPSELDACVNYKNQIYICSQVQIRYSHGSAMCACEINLFNNNTESNCRLRKTPNGFTWIPLLHKNQWIYATTVSSRATAVCGKEIKQLLLKGSGLLSLQPDCILKHNFVSIQAHQSVSSCLRSSYTSLSEITKIAGAEQLTPLLNNMNEAKYTTQIKNLTSLQRLLEMQNVMTLPNKIDAQNTHHIAVGYTALLSAVIILVIMLLKRLLKKRKQQDVSTVAVLSDLTIPPTPKARHQLQTTDFTVHL